MTLLAAEKVSVAYDGHRVLEDLSLEVAPGAWVGLVGPNGAGKSTLLKAMSGIVGYEGRILIDGRDLASMTRRSIARSIAIVPQRPLLPEAMSVREYVLIGRTPYIPYFGAENKHDFEVVKRVVNSLELSHLADRALGSLSGGEAQRVVLARALAQEAPVLLLDEPTNALDIGHQQQVLELVDVLRAKHSLTVIAAMHDLTQASQFAESLVLLDKGRAVAVGPPQDVLTESSIREHYGASVRVVPDGDGGVLVVPIRSRNSMFEGVGIASSADGSSDEGVEV
jgi:iron complex transport system ATP-binding protein